MFLAQIHRILLIAVFLPIFSLSWSQEMNGEYARIKVFANQNELPDLSSIGVAIDHVEWIEDGLIGEFSTWEITKIKESGYQIETLIPDVSAYYAARNYAATAGSRVLSAQSTPNGFSLGSMGGHLTYEEAVLELDSLQTMYPGLVTVKDSIGHSVEGRPIWMVKISDAPQLDEMEPEVLYVGLHHAREPMSMMNLIYFMYDLLDKYGSDPRVTYLINHRELYFIPILNPDGYVFNATTHPNGGGLWRKNRHANGSSTFGVDLNRNYSFAWGHDNIGSSPDPNAATFRGTAPFSEPETMALRQFCAQRDIRTALNYHAWGNSMVIPWGYARNATLVDQEKFHRYGSMLTESNEYLVGSPFQTLGYAANGTSADWMYGNVTDKPQIMALSPEIGGPNDWFWPTANRIIPLCKAQLQANFRIACLAGSCIKVKPELPCELEGSTVHLPVRFMNFGSEADSNFTARFTSSDPHIVGVPVAQLFLPTLGPDQEILDSFSLALAPNIPIGTVIRGVVHTFLRGNIVLLDTVEFSYGVPQVLFSENGESSLNNWTGNWARTTEKSYSGNYSITDSPFSLYAPNASSTLTLQNPIDLSDYTEVMLRYHTTWELQRNWDYVIVNASRNGVDFDPVTGRHTQPGSGSHQPYGEPVYDGSEYAWVLEKIDLSAYSGHDLYLQFVLGSNSNQERDGFYFDDLCVTGYKVLDSRKPQKPFVNMHLFPNPGEGHFQISGMKDGIGPTSLQIFSLLGNKLRDLPANQGGIIDLTSLSAGIYLYTFSDGQGQSAYHKLVLR